MSWTPEATTGVFAITASVMTLLVSQWFQRAAAKDERTSVERRAHAERVFGAREARYADRKDAVIDFLTAVNAEAESISDFEESNQYGARWPGEIHHDYGFPQMNTAYARLVILVPPQVAETAEALQGAVIGAFHGEKEAWTNFRAATDSFRDAARAMLAEDDTTADPSLR